MFGTPTTKNKGGSRCVHISPSLRQKKGLCWHLLSVNRLFQSLLPRNQHPQFMMAPKPHSMRFLNWCLDWAFVEGLFQYLNLRQTTNFRFGRRRHHLLEIYRPDLLMVLLLNLNLLSPGLWVSHFYWNMGLSDYHHLSCWFDQSNYEMLIYQFHRSSVPKDWCNHSHN